MLGVKVGLGVELEVAPEEGVPVGESEGRGVTLGDGEASGSTTPESTKGAEYA